MTTSSSTSPTMGRRYLFRLGPEVELDCLYFCVVNIQETVRRLIVSKLYGLFRDGHEGAGDGRGAG
jgi:hypothetical protein